MKSLVIFYGLPRSIKYTYENIFEKFDINDAERIGVFIDKKNYSNIRSGEKNEEINFKIVEEKLQLNKIILIDENSEELKNYQNIFEKFINRFDDSGGSRRNLVEQLYTLLIASESITDKYEKIYFIRPDLLYLDFETQLNKKISDILIPDWQAFGGYNDRFSICYNMNVAMTYAKRIENAEEYCLEFNTGIHSEELLYFSIAKMKHRVIFTNMRAVRVRNNGYHLIENFNKISYRSLLKRKMFFLRRFL